jgi:imidazolonepropionase-like amidohydrolase
VTLLLWLAGCGAWSDAWPATGASTDVVLRGLNAGGTGTTDLALRNGKIAEIGPGVAPELPSVVSPANQYAIPSFIDSHVHLAYLDEPGQMADGGIAAVLDLAAPIGWIGREMPPLRVLWSGPMITAEGGYPLRSWGADGYGLPVTDPQSARAAVDRIVAAGAKVIKFPVTAPPVLDDATMKALVAAAHSHGLKVVVHALGDGDAARAAAAGADVLGHTPVEPLSDATVAAWSKGVVISTLSAFGSSDAAVRNLRRLREAGATVLYGTDFGNTRTPGIDAEEIRLLVAAGLDGRAIIEAGTATPARVWGFTDLGSLAPKKDASLLVYTEDPGEHPEILASPDQVWVAGVRRK